MNRVASDVSRRNSRRGRYRGLDAARAQICDILIDRVRFPASGFAGQKNIRAGFQDRESFVLGHRDIVYPTNTGLRRFRRVLPTALGEYESDAFALHSLYVTMLLRS